MTTTDQTRCGDTDCNRKASAYRVVVDGDVVRLCSRHAAIDRHNREERARSR